jgi:hypothetical protein
LIVAVVLPLMLVLLIVLAWVLMGMAKGNGRLIVKIETAAIPPKIKFHFDYTSPDRPPEREAVESPGTPALPSKAEAGTGGDVT